MPPRRTVSGCPTATPQQVEYLLEYLKVHPCLAKGFIRGPDARVKKKQLWATVTETLNSLGGAIKTADQWQKVIIHNIAHLGIYLSISLTHFSLH